MGWCAEHQLGNLQVCHGVTALSYDSHFNPYKIFGGRHGYCSWWDFIMPRMEKDQKASCTKIHLSLTALHHRRIFLHFQRAPNLQVVFNLHWQEHHRGVGAITSSFDCFPSDSMPAASAGYVGYLLLQDPRIEEKLKHNFLSRRASCLWVSMPSFKQA